MKSTDFLKEEFDRLEYDDEAGMAKSNLHTIVRAATDLEQRIGDDENLPEWCQEKIAIVKEQLVTVWDYIVSQHEMHGGSGSGSGSEYEFSLESIEKQFDALLNEDDQVDEGVKSKLAAAALAGAIGANAAAPAHADMWDRVMAPVNKVYQVQRDVQNTGREIGRVVSKQADRVGRDLEKIPVFNIDQIGRQVRGTEPIPVAASPEEIARQQQNAERQAELDRSREQQRQERSVRGMQETTSAGVATTMAVGQGPKVGTLFGGSYSQKLPKRRVKKESMIKRPNV